MRWNKTTFRARATVLCLAGVFCAAAPEQQLTVYTAKTSYSIPVVGREGKAYIAVTDLLSPLGASAPRNKGKEWQFDLDKTAARLTESKDRANIRGNQVELGGKVLVENGRVLVPLGAALPLLSRMLNVTVDFHQPSRRIFTGNVYTRFNAAFRDGDSPALVLTFTQPVKRLDINREEDRGLLFNHKQKTTLIFRVDPVVSEVNKQQFGDGPFQSLVYSEENGAASLTITGNARLKMLRSGDGKTITLQAEPPLKPSAPPAAPTPAVTADGQHRAQEFFVMIDPSHGGYDKGGDFGGRVMEKDVTLRLARELRKELQERGIPSRMLRDSDVDVGLERRAEITNEQRAGLYIALHAGRPGKGVRVYAALLAGLPPSAGRFLPWESAQAGALNKAKSAAQAVSAELRKNGLAVANLGLPVRPLNNIVAPAIAVELAPEDDDPQSVESLKRQNAVASAIAAGIAQARSQIGSRP